LWVLHLGFSLHIGTTVFLVPLESLDVGDVFYPDPKIIKVLGACEQEFPRAIVKKIC
jgi:hypothetical protein